jgi:hypothetical protein
VQQQADQQHQNQQRSMRCQASAVGGAGQRGRSAWQSGSAPDLQQLLTEALKQLDLAALMGGLRFRPWLDQLIDTLDGALQALQGGSSSSAVEALQQPPVAASLGRGSVAAAGGQHAAAAAGGAAAGAEQARLSQRPSKQPRLGSVQHVSLLPYVPGTSQDAAHSAAAAAEEQGSGCSLPTTAEPMAAIPAAAAAAGSHVGRASVPSGSLGSALPRVLSVPAGSLTAQSAVVPVEQAPSMEHFMVTYLLPPGGRLCRQGSLLCLCAVGQDLVSR